MAPNVLTPVTCQRRAVHGEVNPGSVWSQGRRGEDRRGRWVCGRTVGLRPRMPPGAGKGVEMTPRGPTSEADPALQTARQSRAVAPGQKVCNNSSQWLQGPRRGPAAVPAGRLPPTPHPRQPPGPPPSPGLPAGPARAPTQDSAGGRTRRGAAASWLPAQALTDSRKTHICCGDLCGVRRLCYFN